MQFLCQEKKNISDFISGFVYETSVFNCAFIKVASLCCEDECGRYFQTTECALAGCVRHLWRLCSGILQPPAGCSALDGLLWVCAMKKICDQLVPVFNPHRKKVCWFFLSFFSGIVIVLLLLLFSSNCVIEESFCYNAADLSQALFAVIASCVFYNRTSCLLCIVICFDIQLLLWQKIFQRTMYVVTRHIVVTYM